MKLLQFILYLGIIIPNIIGVQEYAKNKNQLYSNICLMPGCVTAAANLINNMDTQIDPCEDFYRFACGTYLKEAKVPNDKMSIGTFVTVQDKLNQNLKMAIEQLSHPKELKPFIMIKQLYQMCMDTTSIEENGLTDLKEILNNLGWWPVVKGDNWDDEKFNWKESVYQMRRLGCDSNYFITFNVESDPKNSTRRVITLDQAALALPQEMLVKGDTDKAVKAYYNYMVEVAVILGANRAAALKELKDSFEFEIKLAKISLPQAEWFNATAQYNPFAIKELSQIYSDIEWKQYINNVFDISDIQVDEEETVIVKVPRYMKDLEELLKHTPKRMALATSSLYIRNYFSKEVRENVRTLVRHISSALKNTLEKLDWVDEITRNNSLEKLAFILPNIGYADDMIDDTKLENYYSLIEFNVTNYLRTVLKLSLFASNDAYNKLRQPVNRSEWDMNLSPVIVNAIYVPGKNIIVVPAAILEGAFYDNNRPQYMNYGAIGWILGHEITHGFDGDGRLYDKEGNLANWWTDETNIEFLSKAECLIDQYSNYSIPELELNVNGKLTLNENIADNGGLKAAYLAYKEWVKHNDAETVLPGLNYTADQLFWISVANTWCSKRHQEYAKQLILIDPHSPDEFRIRGSFSNSEYFANDFKCPLGSKMNPVNKCHVW